MKIDTQGPTHNVSITNANGAFLNGTTLYYKGNAAGSFQFNDALTDSSSGPASVTYPAIGTTGWTHSTPDVKTTSPFTSNAFSWSANPSNPSGYQITGADNATNTRNLPISFVSDTNVAPGGTVSYTSSPAYAANAASPNVQVALTASDAGSGLATASLERASATLTAPTTCGSFGSFTPIASNPNSPYQDGNIATASCYRYQYRLTDNVGNTAVFPASQTNNALVDLTPPTISTTFPVAGTTYTTWSSTSSGAGCKDGMCGPAADTGGSGIAAASSIQVQLQRTSAPAPNNNDNCWDGVNRGFTVPAASCPWVNASSFSSGAWKESFDRNDFGPVPSGETWSFILRTRVTDRAGNLTNGSSTAFSLTGPG